MDQFSRYNFLHNTFISLGRVCGFRILEKEWIDQKWIKFNLVMCGFVTICYFYNLNKFWGDFEFVCYSTIIISPLMGGAFRLIHWPRKKDTIMILYYDHIKFCQRYLETSKQGRVVQKYVISLNFFMTWLFVFIFLIGFLTVVTPLLIYIFLGESMVLPFPVYIMILDFESHPWYEINYIWQLYLIYEVVACFGIIQVLTLLFIGASTMQIEVLQTMVNEMEQVILLDLDDNSKTIKWKFAEIIDFHNEVIKYAALGENVLTFQYLLDVTTLTTLVVIALFYARLANWIPGYFVAIFVLIGAFLNYALGELNCIQLEKLNKAVYNISWYRMKNPLQKMVLILLQKTQNSIFFTCGGLRPINVDLFASFANTVYSYLLILKDMENKLGF